MKPTYLPLLLSISLLLCGCGNNKKTSSSNPLEKRVDSLLALMTLEEKVGQLIQYNGTWDVTGPVPEGGDAELKYQHIKEGKVGSMLNVLSAEATMEAQKLAVENSRLGIPLLFAYDVIHGYKTLMPIPLAEVSSWDMNTIERSTGVAAKEAAAAGINWAFAPVVDIARDARWGRIMEGAGEDTYLSSLVAAARVRGFQGDDLTAPHTIAATAKHLAAYGFAEAGREYNTVDISRHTLHNVVLPPFKAAADEGVASVMNAFNEIGGVPATADGYLQRKILKGLWNYDGVVVSDWASIGELVVHGVAADKKEAAEIAIKAGCDVDMESKSYENLIELVNEGIVAQSLVDDAAKRILRLKFRLGLFEDPFRYSDSNREKEWTARKEYLTIGREAGRKSIVLLKNENNLLPIKSDVKSIAVIGSIASDSDIPLGNWRGKAERGSAVSLLDGIKSAAGDIKVSYAEGFKVIEEEITFIQKLKLAQEDRSGFREAIRLARRSDLVILALGEHCFQTGEGRSQVDISLRDIQEDLLAEIKKVNPNVVVVLMNGRPLAIPKVDELAPSILETWYLGSETGNAIADVLFGKYNPSGKLPVSFPRHGGQLPLYYNQKNTGRPTTGAGMVFYSHYADESNEALYPFGYGLSYSSFEYGDISLSQNEVSPGGNITASVVVKNTSSIDGEEIVQLYIRDLVGSVTRPIKELKGFEKVMIPAGQSKTVEFTIDEKLLEFYTANDKWETEPGKFHLMIGPNSRDLQMVEFELKR